MTYYYTDGPLDTETKKWKDKEKSKLLSEKFGIKMDLSKLNESDDKETLNEGDCWGTKENKVANVYKMMPFSKRKTGDGYHEISSHEKGGSIVLEELTLEELEYLEERIEKILEDKLVGKAKKVKTDKVGNHEADKEWEKPSKGLNKQDKETKSSTKDRKYAGGSEKKHNPWETDDVANTTKDGDDGMHGASSKKPTKNNLMETADDLEGLGDYSKDPDPVEPAWDKEKLDYKSDPLEKYYEEFPWLKNDAEQDIDPPDGDIKKK